MKIQDTESKKKSNKYLEKENSCNILTAVIVTF